MPKAKSRKSVLNRFRITKHGKVLRRQAFRRHLKAGKSKKRLKNLKRVKEMTGHFARRIKRRVQSV